ncbi:MAG: glycosyltransferase [Verrucomicrobiota bacterium]
MRPAPFPPLPGGVLSVIVPIYNEAATVGAALDTILAKEIPGWRLEIILVESNSTDGTRDAVLARRDHPRRSPAGSRRTAAGSQGNPC